MNDDQEASPNLYEAIGIIVPAEWDPNGKPNAWSLSTYDENLYQIDTGTEEGRLMGSFAGRAIRVFGQLNETESGRRLITVEKYTLLNNPEIFQGGSNILQARGAKAP